jgi:hypothetical protein
MEVGAHEDFHTHASDIVVVHLSGGAIEDTADGQTKVNRWKQMSSSRREVPATPPATSVQLSTPCSSR